MLKLQLNQEELESYQKDSIIKNMFILNNFYTILCNNELLI